MELPNIEKLESQNHPPQKNGASFITTCFNGLNALTGKIYLCIYFLGFKYDFI